MLLRAVSILALFPFAALLAQQFSLLDDPSLEEALMRHSDRRLPAGVPFPREYLSCQFYEVAIVKRLIRNDDDSPKLFFTSVPTKHASYSLFPNIVHRADGGDWVRTPNPATSDGWTYVYASADGRNLLITMDNIPESPGWETRVVRSEDGGNTWHYGERLRKYVYFDAIQYLHFDDTGEGIAAEFYDGDVGGYDDVGYYIFETTDWGRTWSDRRYAASLDTSGFIDVFDDYEALRKAQIPLSEFDLAGFEDCLAR